MWLLLGFVMTVQAIVLEIEAVKIENGRGLEALVVVCVHERDKGFDFWVIGLLLIRYIYCYTMQSTSCQGHNVVDNANANAKCTWVLTC
ncbi:hypothetical protein V6N12_048980 [Hibiscus sabdariffa]|uniref:Secreted protein n=1 Tax=Hibiscus sabdariffa TaxID=183260 RepID=A0ABR2EIU8_9ROSI